MNLTVGEIVWARRNKDDIYWPGKLTIISNNTNDLWSSEIHYNYLVQFFVTNQSIWITDILPYQQYRDSMTNESFMNYGLHPTIKQDFLNAINQADYASSNDFTSMTTQQQKLVPIIEDNTDNDFLLTPGPMFTSNTVSSSNKILESDLINSITSEEYLVEEDYNSPYRQSSIPTSNITIQSLDTFSSNNNSNNKTTQAFPTTNDWYTQQGLIVESITPPLPAQNDNQLEYISSPDNIQQTNSIIILTTKTYSNSSFISYLFNCFSTFPHHSIIYIDDLTTKNYQHPNTSNISYLICLDYFDSIIKQTLNSTILNNLNVHINYLFLLINAPSYELIKHFYTIIMDKRMIVILHYHSTFDNESLLLCSGNRITYEMIRSTILNYLCSKVKYIESQGDEDEQLYSSYCISSIIQSTNILNHFVDEQIHQTLNEKFEYDFLQNNSNVINELFPQLSINQNSNQNNLLQLIHQSDEDILNNQSKQSTIMNDLFQNRIIKTHIPPPICEYYVQNILHEN